VSPPRVCEACARRTWLLGRLAAHLDLARARIDELLGLDELSLVAAVAGRERDLVRRGLADFDPGAEAARRDRAELEAVCRCDPGYPPALRELPAAPAVLHVAGELARLHALVSEPPVAIVGARRATEYGRETAHGLAGQLASAGLTVVSGMALGIDAAAHAGALAAGGVSLAVLPGGADRAYPAAHRRLHGQLRERGVAVSELGPGIAPRRWMFPARNRIIAALAAMTVVVQAGERSGALLTAAWARRLGRALGAVPGHIRSPLSAGPHALLRGGATLVAGAGEVLDAVYGADAARPGADRSPPPPAAPLAPPLAALLEALADGEPPPAAFVRAGLDADRGLAALASLELGGLVRRGAGGRYVVAW
jgi:DNA processing protein